MTLTDTQARILRDMAGGAEYRRMSGWKQVHNKKEVIPPAAINALLRKGMVEISEIIDGWEYLTLTPAGAAEVQR